MIELAPREHLERCFTRAILPSGRRGSMRTFTQDWLLSELGEGGDLSARDFVGRRRELATLAGLLDAGKARCALIEGEVGIGKTALAEEFLERTREKGVRVLRARCYRMPEAGAYFPLLQALDQLPLGATGSREALEKLAAQSGRSRDHLGTGDEDRSRRVLFLRGLTTAIVTAVASTTTVLCIDDIQWADVGSLLLLNNLLDITAAGLFIVCTRRQEEPLDADVHHL